MSSNKSVFTGLRGTKSEPILLLTIKKKSNTNTTGQDQSVALKAKYRKTKDTECFATQIPKTHFEGKLAYWNNSSLTACAKTEDGKQYRWMGLQAPKDKKIRFVTY
jgi:hypothetical protein